MQYGSLSTNGLGTTVTTNGTAIITGSGTLWDTSSLVVAGNLFTIDGSNYEIGSVDSETQLTLTSIFAGADDSGQVYVVSSAFTANHGLAYTERGDVETAALNKRAISDIDSLLANLSIDGSEFTGVTSYLAENGSINGLCLINQKPVVLDAAAVSTTNNEYPIDMHKTTLIGVTGTHQWLSTNQPTNINGYSLRYAATSTTSGQIGSKQIVETYDRYTGVEVTRSRRIKSNSSNARLVIDDGVTKTSSDPHTGGGGWELLTITTTIDASSSKLECYAVIASAALVNVSITIGDYIEFTDTRLDRGNRRLSGNRTHQQELEECRRFWYQPTTGQAYSFYGSGFASSTTRCHILLHHDELSNIADALAPSGNLKLTNNTGNYAVTAISIDASNSSSVLTKLKVDVASGLTAGEGYTLSNDNDATATIGVGNES